MSRFSVYATAVVLGGAMVMGLAEPASATKTKKMTYEQAWAACRTQVSQSVPGDQHSARHSAGSACMRKHGHRI